MERRTDQIWFSANINYTGRPFCKVGLDSNTNMDLVRISSFWTMGLPWSRKWPIPWHSKRPQVRQAGLQVQVRPDSVRSCNALCNMAGYGCGSHCRVLNFWMSVACPTCLQWAPIGRLGAVYTNDHCSDCCMDSCQTVRSMGFIIASTSHSGIWSGGWERALSLWPHSGASISSTVRTSAWLVVKTFVAHVDEFLQGADAWTF